MQAAVVVSIVGRVVCLLYRPVSLKLHLKFGQVVVVAQAIPAVTVVPSQLEEQAVTMQQKRLLQHLDVSTRYALADHGHVTHHTLVAQEWDVVHT
jgi:hypothetical protein